MTYSNLWSVLALLALLLPGCATNGGDAAAKPQKVSWDRAVEIVTAGGVESVFQTHSRRVTITLHDGRVFTTTEPSIDLIFDVIDDCGEPCAEILKVTE